MLVNAASVGITPFSADGPHHDGSATHTYRQEAYMFHSTKAVAMRPLIAGCLIALFAASPLRAAEDGDKVVATVNGTEITETDVAIAAQDYAQDLAQVPEQLRRNLLVGVLVDMHVLAEASLAEGRDKDPDVQKQLEYVRLRTLRDSYFNDEKTLKPDEAAIKALYDEKYADYEGPKEVHARHILMKTEEEAKEIIKELDAGKDFVELAKEKSTGPSGPQGGDLGFFTKERMVEPFAEAAFAMEPGTYSKEPVKTQFGWHVIKVEEARNQPAPNLETIEEQLRVQVIRNQYNKVMEDLKAKADITIVDDAPEEAPAAAGEGESKPAE